MPTHKYNSGYPVGRTIALIIITISVLSLAEFIYSIYRVPPGLYLGDNYIAGWTYTELNFLLDDLAADVEHKTVIFFAPGPDTTVQYRLWDLGIGLDRDRIMQEIKSAGKPFHFRGKFALLRSPVRIPLFYRFNHALLQEVGHELEELIKINRSNAQVWARNGELVYKPHCHGSALDRGDFVAQLTSRLSSWPAFPLEIPLQLMRQEADITISDILDKGIKHKIYTATTVFNPDNENRVHNIVLAAAQINNIVIEPGGVFSFNKQVGKADQDSGYKDAPIIINDQIVAGPGGGICQVSSTLYNAALMVGLTILERHNHGLPVTYLPPGMDAAVAYDYLDLKFINELNTSILLNVEPGDGRLDVNIFGNAARVDEIKLLKQDLVKIPPPEHYRVIRGRPAGYREIIQMGKPGYAVEMLRIFYRHGHEINRESLGRDYYAPVPYIYAVSDLPVEKENNN